MIKLYQNGFMKLKNNKINLRYGENPKQNAFLISRTSKTIFDFQLNGKEISYNNIIDLDSGLKCINEFDEPTSIILKHTNPCGVASSNKIINAFKKSYSCDYKSAFGGVVILNRKVNLELAKIINKNFFEIIAAPFFTKDSLEVLKRKKKLILIKIPSLKKQMIDYRSTLFGDLYQSRDLNLINKKFLSLVSKKKAKTKLVDDLIFSLKVVKHLKSNAIVLSKNKQTVGLGHGQTNRVDALNFAIKNKNIYFKNKTFVCASDGFFPFTDSINLLYKNGCEIVAQPNGSINDNKIIDFSIENKISLYFTKNRLFKH